MTPLYQKKIKENKRQKISADRRGPKLMQSKWSSIRCIKLCQLELWTSTTGLQVIGIKAVISKSKTGNIPIA